MASSSLRSLHCRATLRVGHSPRSPGCLSARAASTHDHYTHATDEAATPESFNNPFWRKTAIFTVLGYGLYLLAPSKASVDGHEGSLTSFIRKSLTPADEWRRRNEQHLLLSVDSASARQLTETAQRPVMGRIRYVGRFEDYSPHKQPVGDAVDLSDLQVKSDSHFMKH